MNLSAWKDLSLAQLSACLSAALIGLILRVAFPDLVGFSSDEIASLYFAENPGKIFSTETHPPVFYLLLSGVSGFLDPYTIRVFLGLLSFTLITLIVVLSRRIYSPAGVCILAILLFLSPAGIFHARMIRQYSLFLELSVLLFILQRRDSPVAYRFLLSIIVTGIHPLGWIPPVSIGLMSAWKGQGGLRKGFLWFVSCIPVLLYYALKHFFSQNNGIVGTFDASGIKYAPFYIDIINTFSGDHFPRINYLPVPQSSFFFTLVLVLVIIAVGIYHWRKTKLFPHELVLLGLMATISLIFIEVFSLLIKDIHNGRYVIFLLAPIYLLAARGLETFRFSEVLLLGPLVVNLVLLKPLQVYHCERESYNFFIEARQRKENLDLVLCGNPFHYWYYLKKDHQSCLQDFERLSRSKSEFVVVDLNGVGFKAIAAYGEKIRVHEFKSHGYTKAMLVSFRDP